MIERGLDGPAAVVRTPLEPGQFLALAPMDGVTDWVYRALMTALFDGESGISLCASEFVRISQAPATRKVLLRHCPELLTGGCTSAGVPVFVQLLGGDPDFMASSAALAVELGASGIDLNFGCPAKTVNRRDGGASLLRDPARLSRIVAAVVRAVDSAVEVSVKIRTGWSDADSVEVLARAAEQGGASWLTVHGRTKTDGYGPPADWRAIGRARRAVSIPVVANGDLNRSEDLQDCSVASGCRAFMIGRGALGRPWLFRQLSGDAHALDSCGTLESLLLDYVRRLLDAGVPERAALGRLKQWLCLGSRVNGALVASFEAVKRHRELAGALTALCAVVPTPRVLQASASAA